MPRMARGSHTRDRRPHFVYQLWGRGRCLYVGSTSSLPQRLATHAKKWWWEEVVRVECQIHQGRTRALDAEYALIAELQPEHNRLGADSELREQMRALGA